MRIRKIHQKTTIIAVLFLILFPYGSFAADLAPLSGCDEVNPDITVSTLLAAFSASNDAQPPSTPGNLAVIHKTTTSVSLSWAKSSDNEAVKGYRIFRDGKKIGSCTETSYTNMHLTPGRQYIYMVKAFDAKGNISAGSDSLAVSTLSDSQSPSVPLSPSVSDLTFTSAKLEWGPSTDNVEIKGYEIFRDGVKKAVTGGTSYICKGLSSGRSYAFSIRSLDTAGNYSPFANINISTKTDAAVPTTPNGLKAATVTGTEATLTWIASTDNVRVKGYEIFNEGKKVGSSVKAVWKYNKLSPGKPTTFTVRAVDTSGLVSAQSTPYTITAPSDKTSPTVPGNLRLKSSGSANAGLSWDASTDNIKVAGYRLYCNGSVIADTTKTSRSVKITKGLTLSIYWVRAYDQSENLSEKSNSVTIASYK